MSAAERSVPELYEELDRHVRAAQDWADGRRSTWNDFSYDQDHGRERAAVCDAAMAHSHASAAQAIAEQIRTRQR